MIENSEPVQPLEAAESLPTISEPRDHLDRRSKLERVWEELPPGHGLGHHRTKMFDDVSGITFSPVEYEVRALGPKGSSPNGAWISAALADFVRGEFGNSIPQRHTDLDSPEIDTLPAEPDIASRYIEQCEAELVFGDAIQAVHAARARDPVDVMYEILCHDTIGNAATRKYYDEATLKGELRQRFEARERLQLVFLGFPFKDQNPFRTEAPADCPDLGEIAFLIRLHALAISLYTVHPYGVDWIIVTDGDVYEPILGYPYGSAKRYANRLREIRYDLNIQGSISFIPLSDLLSRYGGDGEAEAGIGDIYDALKADDSPEGRQALSTLARGLLWNYASRQATDALSRQGAWQLLNGIEPQTSQIELSLRQELTAKANDASLQYAAVNLFLKQESVIRRFFPQALRATVHPKPGQIALPQLGSVFPWNGVGVLTSGSGRVDIGVTPLHALRRRGVRVSRFVDAAGAPSYYAVTDATGQ